MIFHVSHNSVTKDGETAEEREAHLVKNVDRQRRRDVEVAQVTDEDGRGPPTINVIYKQHSTWWATSQSTRLRVPI